MLKGVMRGIGNLWVVERKTLLGKPAATHGVGFLKDVSKAFKTKEPYASRLLAQAVLSGKIQKPGASEGVDCD